MNRQIIFAVSLVAIAVLLPELGFATDAGSDLLDGKLSKEMGDLTKTLFGAPIKIAGVLSGGYGLLQCYIAASPKPLLMWGSVALLSFFMQPIITAIFGISFAMAGS